MVFLVSIAFRVRGFPDRSSVLQSLTITIGSSTEKLKSEPSEPDRIAVLEELLKKKNQELIDAGLRPAPIQTEKEEIPEPAPPSFGASTAPNG